ncbi:MAG TPA: glycosyltransferase [Legionellales bacterium]|nr:glycosyltransferase [Legionellales bacterium]
MKSTFDTKISVIVPLYNEQEVIEQFLKRSLAVLEKHFEWFEIILVDDGSTDLGVQKCLPYIHRYSQIRLLKFSRNYGHEIASTAGFDHAKGNFVVLMDADLQHPPELIPEMMKKAQEGFDVVCAQQKERPAESKLRRLFSKLYYKVSKRMTGLEIPEGQGNFRLLSRTAVESLKLMRENNRHLVMLFAYMGFDTASVYYDCPPRAAGQSKYNFKKLINLALDSIIGFSGRPLRTMAKFSIFISFVMMIYAGFILIEKLLSPEHLIDGLASVIFLIAGLFSILFLFLAFISEYISRILIETKNRPLYYIQQEFRKEVK